MIVSPARACIVPLIAVWMAVSAHAIDGVIEINQPLALAGSITPEDAPGFPVTLSSAGSGIGIDAEANVASVLAGNATTGNGGDGLAGLFGGNVIRSNTAAGNGVRASDGAVVMRNRLQFNLTRNFFLNASAGYALDVVTTTAANPTTVVGGVNLGGNLCDNGACP